MSKSKLHALGAKLKHAQLARVLLTSPRSILKEEGDKSELIVAVPLKHEKECQSLVRLGREPLTQLMAHEILSCEETISRMIDVPNTLSRFRSTIMDDDKTKYCLVLCSVIRREVNLTGGLLR